MTTTDPRKVSYLPLASLDADPRNPKAHDEEMIDASIGRFGVLDLIVRDERTGFIISGHGRKKALSAMEERGESAPEGVTVGEDGKWLVPVATGWSSRTDSEAAAALIAMNRTTEVGGWVDDALLDLLSDLSDQEDGMVGVGFDDSDIDALTALLGEDSHDEGPRDLDGLAEEFGEVSEGDQLSKVTLNLDAEVAGRLFEHLLGFPDHTKAVEDWLGQVGE